MALIVLACLACVARAQPANDLAGDLNRAIQRESGGGFWGVALVARGGEIIFERGYGFADYDAEPNTPDTLFEIASISKPFTATTVLRLCQDGVLELDGSIGQVLTGVPADKRGITIRHLLSHTSGLSGSVGLPYNSNAVRAELIRLMLESEMAAVPGEQFAYCNSCFALLAAIVEEATGEQFEDVVRRLVFEPAGMQHTGFIGDERLRGMPVSSRISSSNPDATAVDWHWSWGYRGMGGVVTTARDLVLFDQALRGGRLLAGATKTEMYQPGLEAFALGWRISTTPRGTLAATHGGAVEGYRCQFTRYLDEDTVTVVLSNDRDDVYAIDQAMSSVLFPPPRIDVELDWSGYTLGQYQHLSMDRPGAWRARAEGDALVLTLADPEQDHTLVTVTAPAAQAKALATQLRTLVAQREAAGEADGAEAALNMGLYLYPYPAADLERQHLALEGCKLTFMPRYNGVGEGGEPVTDERIMLLVVDEARTQWAVMTKMNLASAQAFLRELAQAAGE